MFDKFFNSRKENELDLGAEEKALENLKPETRGGLTVVEENESGLSLVDSADGGISVVGGETDKINEIKITERVDLDPEVAKLRDREKKIEKERTEEVTQAWKGSEKERLARLEEIKKKKEELYDEAWNEAIKDEQKRRNRLTQEEKDMEDMGQRTQKAELAHREWLERLRSRYSQIHERMLCDWKKLWHERSSHGNFWHPESEEHKQFVLIFLEEFKPEDLKEEIPRYLPIDMKAVRERFRNRIEPRLMALFKYETSDVPVKAIIQDAKNLRDLLELEEVPIYTVGAIYGRKDGFQPTPEFFTSLDAWLKWAKDRHVYLEELLLAIRFNKDGTVLVTQNLGEKYKKGVFTPEEIEALKKDNTKPPEIDIK